MLVYKVAIGSLLSKLLVKFVSSCYMENASQTVDL